MGHHPCMTRLFRPFLILLTVLALASYGSAALAKGAGVTQMVICGSAGAETIWLDVSGNPAEAPQDCCSCLDCLTFSDVCLPDAARGALGYPVPDRLTTVQMTEPRRTFPCPAPMPRGPPSGQLVKASTHRVTAEPDLRRIAPMLLDVRQVTCGQSVAERRANQKDARP